MRFAVLLFFTGKSSSLPRQYKRYNEIKTWIFFYRGTQNYKICLIRQHQLKRKMYCGYFCKGPEETETFVSFPLLHIPPLLSCSLVSFTCDNTGVILVGLLLRENQIWGFALMYLPVKAARQQWQLYNYLDKALG